MEGKGNLTQIHQLNVHFSRFQGEDKELADTEKASILATLRILTGKKHPKIKLPCLRKIRIWTFGSLVHQINSS